MASPSPVAAVASSYRVLPARVDDLPWIVGQLEAFTRYFPSKKSLRGPDKFWADGLRTMIENHVFLIAWRIESEKAIAPVGLIAGTLAPHPFNPDLTMLCESFWWVAPEHRGSRAGLLLLNEWIKIGKEKADWVTIATEAISPVNERCLTRRGFRLFEKSYLLEVDQCQQ